MDSIHHQVYCVVKYFVFPRHLTDLLIFYVVICCYVTVQ